MAGAIATRPADVDLKREMGLIGAICSSETTIIGSGWLFGSWYAASAAGAAAILCWVIGGVAIIILALVHSELGGMYPVAGGTARFPHFAFGGLAGISFGFFSWVPGITVARLRPSRWCSTPSTTDTASTRGRLRTSPGWASGCRSP